MITLASFVVRRWQPVRSCHAITFSIHIVCARGFSVSSHVPRVAWMCCRKLLLLQPHHHNSNSHNNNLSNRHHQMLLNSRLLVLPECLHQCLQILWLVFLQLFHQVYIQLFQYQGTVVEQGQHQRAPCRAWGMFHLLSSLLRMVVLWVSLWELDSLQCS